MKVRSYVALACGLSAATLACIPTQNRRPVEQQRSPRGEVVGGRRDRPAPVEDARLSTFGLELFWDSYIRDETISKLQLEADPVTGQGSIYAFTESYRLYQVDAASGKVNWVFDVGHPLDFISHDRPICEFNYSKSDNDTIKRYDEVYFVAKDTLYALDKKDGAQLWQLELKFPPASPPQATNTHVIVGAWDHRAYAVPKNFPVTYDWTYRTDGDVTARPGQDSPSTFVASTDGKLYTFDAAKGSLTSTFNTEKRLSADPIVYKKLIYLGAEDFNLYVISALDGRQEFRYPTGSPIKKAPVCIANPTEKGKATATIYVTTEGPEGGVVAILRGGRVPGSTKTSHEFLWKRDGAYQVIARGRETVYLLEPAGGNESIRTKRVVKVDAKSAYLRDEIKLNGIDYYLTNPVDPNDKKTLLGGMVLCGYRNGWILAYKEKSPYPAD